MGKKVLLTGSHGYIGRHVASALAARGNVVYGVDISANETFPNVTNLSGNILDDPAFVVGLPQVDVLLHLAWQDGFNHNASSHLANLNKHIEFCRAIMQNGCRQVAIMGSMHEVGYWEGAVDENTPCNPFSMYGIAKNAFRQAIMVECTKKGVLLQWLRGFYIYGDDEHNHSIFSKLIQASRDGHKTFPFTSGKNKYDFTPVETLAEMIAATVSQQEVAGIINCASGCPVSLGEKVERFIKDHEFDIKLDYGAFPDRPYDSPAIWGDATKIKMIMGNAK